MKRLKIIFMGTPTFSIPILEGLIDNHDVILVVTQPDKVVGRDKKLHHTYVKKIALKHGVEVFQPVNLKKECKWIIDLKPDYIITCAYGQIIPNEILEAFPHRCINVHASLLPKYRGGAPIHRAIMRGEYETGITIMEMVSRLDAGDIIAQSKIAITDYDNAGTMHEKLSILGRDFLLEILPNIDNMPRTRQNEIESTNAFNITREDEHLNFDTAKRGVYNYIRGLYPWPQAYALLNNKEIKILESYIKDDMHYDKVSGEIVAIYPDGIGVNTRDGEIVITKVKPEGKGEMLVKDYLNGLNDKQKLIGKVFQ